MLDQWLRNRGATEVVPDIALIPSGFSERRFVLATVLLSKLEFATHRYNPRTPSPAKVKELAASIRYLSLLTPLTCAYLEKDERDEDDDEVVLIDGRHRFEALKDLAAFDARWGKIAKVDLKVYWGLPKSDLYVLSTYMNRTRRNLKRGEYYQFIVKIYEQRKGELEGERGEPQTEEVIFLAVSAKELTDRNLDLSVGRIVGITAFDDEEDQAWYPMVGNHQNQRILSDPSLGYCPLTAGNMAELLRYLCLPRAYKDRGEKRSVEIAHVLRLGEKFRKRILKPVESYGEATATTVACKHWCLSAFGSILQESGVFRPSESGNGSPLSAVRQNWPAMEKALDAYYEIMGKQAEYINAYRTTEDLSWLRKAWSYQTQTAQIKGPLYDALLESVPQIEARSAPT